MTIRSPFKPHYGTCQAVTAAAGSASITIGKGDKTLKILNTGSNIAFFRVGAGATTATSADCPIVSGTLCYIEKATDDDTFAYISAVGTTLQIMSGEGGL